MKLSCVLGHRANHGISNRCIVFGTCEQCGRDVIRLDLTHWYALPKGYVISWKTKGSHAVSAQRIFFEARRQSPLLHRFRRKISRDKWFYV